MKQNSLGLAYIRILNWNNSVQIQNITAKPAEKDQDILTFHWKQPTKKDLPTQKWVSLTQKSVCPPIHIRSNHSLQYTAPKWWVVPSWGHGQLTQTDLNRLKNKASGKLLKFSKASVKPLGQNSPMQQSRLGNNWEPGEQVAQSPHWSAVQRNIWFLCWILLLFTLLLLKLPIPHSPGWPDLTTSYWLQTWVIYSPGASGIILCWITVSSVPYEMSRYMQHPCPQITI